MDIQKLWVRLCELKELMSPVQKAITGFALLFLVFLLYTKRYVLSVAMLLSIAGTLQVVNTRLKSKKADAVLVGGK